MGRYKFLTNYITNEDPTFEEVKLSGLWTGGNAGGRNNYIAKGKDFANIPIKILYGFSAVTGYGNLIVAIRLSDLQPFEFSNKLFTARAFEDDNDGEKSISKHLIYFMGEAGSWTSTTSGNIVFQGLSGGSVYHSSYKNDDIPAIYQGEGETLADWIEYISSIIDDGVWTGGNDPYDPGETSQGGVGGDGDYNTNSDPIAIPSLPTLSAVTSGMLTLFHPSLSDIQDLSNYLWSDAFDVETWKKVFGNPMDAILGLSIVPVAVPDVGSRPVVLGNIDTGLTFPGASSQYVEVDCGGVSIENFWGSYLDYAPYTKVDLYLPFCGVHPIDVDDVMGKNVNVVYHVDVLSGACVAMVKSGDSVLYSFAGHCATQIPITGANWTQMIHGALTIAGSIGTMIASGGMSAPLVTGIASTAVNSMKPSIEKSGSLGGSAGFLGVQKPYFIITRPRQCVPASQAHYIGYPSFVTSNLGDLTGYTEIDSIHLENIPATQGEINEIESLLKEGVIL